ncbi:hypothetical protein SK069_10780 [Patulibacter brassicae]|uniref:Restriction endonuclease type IV Mrr domain-containing protein n=1 Tax=Patulibacter brassicae TaxID=1705717 RepID=A0ABU4VJS6_9ACTN|nr:hypothetical protein [Patulibacter brassicae]MDX8152080.1 hypothetical protein [Patulibacter brassicae]
MAALRTAVRATATVVEERESDGAFLESVLEAALIAELPGEARRTGGGTQAIQDFDRSPGGFDIEWRFGDRRIAIETKVTDIRHSVFDVMKLALAVRHGVVAGGACVIAATASQWARGGIVTEMTDSGSHAGWRSWWSDEILADPRNRHEIDVPTPRPLRVPARFETLAGPICPMPLAPEQVLRAFLIRVPEPELIDAL